MRYPKLKPLPTERQLIQVFRGYNHNLRVSAGEFYEMENLSSDDYPVLSPRQGRSVYASPASPQALLAREKLCYVDGSDFVMEEQRYPMGLSVKEEDCPKTLCSMGAYVIILPDKKYINTISPEDRGDIEAVFTTTGEVSLTGCTLTGEVMADPIVSATAPEAPENQQLWIDTAEIPHVLKRYSAPEKMWVSIASPYIRLAAAGIGEAFRVYDGVSISGIPEETGVMASAVIQAVEKDAIVIPGLLEKAMTLQTPITVARKMPVLDFITESGNRLWGCRFGLNEKGETVNEIYASKLGDFRNWNCFLGVNTDSYAASCGTDGPFTGAVTYLGNPLFFKENCVHRVFGTMPSNFQIEATACRGVQKGCHKSLAIVNETLYYKSPGGVSAYDGSLPVDAGYPLGRESYCDAVGGAYGSKYYLSMKDSKGDWHLFVRDCMRSVWHREDHFQAEAFAGCEGKLFAIDGKSRNILSMVDGEGTDVVWMAQTGELGLASPDRKYISRINLRMQLSPGSELGIYAQYDKSGTWEELAQLRFTTLQSFSIPVRPRRCDFLQLQFRGKGPGKIYSMTKTIEGGSDL